MFTAPFSSGFPDPLFNSSDMDMDLGPMSPQAAFFKDMGTWNRANRRPSIDAFQQQQQQQQPQSPRERVIPIQIQRSDVSKNKNNAKLHQNYNFSFQNTAATAAAAATAASAPGQGIPWAAVQPQRDSASAEGHLE